MRKLAKVLSVQAPALYWYFTNKQELLQAMAETMENDLPDVPAGSWQEQLQTFMANYYDLYLQYPCGAELEIHTIPSYPSRLLHFRANDHYIDRSRLHSCPKPSNRSGIASSLIGTLTRSSKKKNNYEQKL